MTREQYLQAIIDAARPMFESIGAPVPDNVRASVGLPRSRKAFGECWRSVCSSDKGREIFVSPVLVEPLRIADTLVHEICHAALADGIGHKSPFVKLARQMQLEGKATATVGGESFKATWQPIVAQLGQYPGVAFDPKAGPPKQSTRMIKVECGTCGFVFRTTKKWIEQTEIMHCPNASCGGEVAIAL